MSSVECRVREGIDCEKREVTVLWWVGVSHRMKRLGCGMVDEVKAR